MCRSNDGWHVDDAATVQGLTVLFPVIPETYESEYVTVPHLDVVWNPVDVALMFTAGQSMLV